MDPCVYVPTSVWRVYFGTGVFSEFDTLEEALNYVKSKGFAAYDVFLKRVNYKSDGRYTNETENTS